MLLVGRQANLRGEPRSDLMAVPFAPLSAVLRRSSAVVHHGGFGTTATTLRSGLPALVVPRAFDQLYHGRRVAELGVGRTLPWQKLDAGRLAAELRILLRDDAYRSRAAALRSRLEGENGAPVAIGRLEALLARRAG